MRSSVPIISPPCVNFGEEFLQPRQQFDGVEFVVKFPEFSRHALDDEQLEERKREGGVLLPDEPCHCIELLFVPFGAGGTEISEELQVLSDVGI